MEYMDSYYEFKIASSFRKKKYFPKTEDITTTSGYAYLINNDEFQLYKDLEYLRTLESMAFDLILCEDKTEDADIDEDKCLKIGESLLENYDYGLLLFVSDQKTDKNCIQVNLDGISDLEGYFDCVIINLNKSIADKKEDEITQIFLEILSRVRSGDLAIIPNTTYEHLQSKRRGVEALLKVLNFRIEVPQQEIKDLIIASKTL